MSPTPRRDRYESHREQSSSRHTRSGDWHVPEAELQHDHYPYNSSQDTYHRSSRADYDVGVRDHSDWRTRDAQYSSSSSRRDEWSRHDDYVPPAYQEPSSSAIYDKRTYDPWVIDEPPRPHVSHSDRDHSYYEQDVHRWDRSDRRGTGDRNRASDSGWEQRRSDSGWEGQRRNIPQSPTHEERTWEPAPSWQSSHRVQSHGHRQNTGQQRNHANRNRNGKKNNQQNRQQSKRDWRNDDSHLNNWQRRDANAPADVRLSPKKASGSAHKRKHLPSQSRSRSPAETRHSRRSRSPMGSVSPDSKRRRANESPTLPHSPPSSERGRRHRSAIDEPKEYSPARSHLSHDSKGAGRRSLSLSTASRSSGSISPERRAIHRLPTASKPVDIALLPSPSKSRREPSQQAGGKKNKRRNNGRHHTSAGGPMQSRSTIPPPSMTHLPILLPRPGVVDTPRLPPLVSTIEPVTTPSSRPLVKIGGFKPIGKPSQAVKRFFPDEDESEIFRPKDSPRTSPTQSTLPLVESGSKLRERSPTIPVATKARNYTPREDEHEGWASHPPPRRMDVDTQQASKSLVRDIPAGPPLSYSTDDQLNQTTSPTHAPSPGHPSTSSMPRDLYTIVNQVGEGTFGKVYKAQNTITNVLVALKRIRMEVEREGFPVTAMREIKLLQSLRHDNIVRLYEMMVSNGSVFMVFEYMDHDLTGILSQSQFKFTDANLKSLCHQMLDGLAHLHYKGIIHRDIKGSNILLNNRGELKLADFGLARFYQKRRRTDYTNRVITLWYRPPELLFGATVYGPEVDMWSAGCIMLELFTKRPVFQGNDEIHQLDVIYKIIGTPTPDRWPGMLNLPWYELIKPRDIIPNHFRTLFEKWMCPSAISLAEQLLCYDPVQRATALQAMDAPYFKEQPLAEMPIGLADIEGEWHELETKLERAKKRRRKDGLDNPNGATTNMGSADNQNF